MPAPTNLIMRVLTYAVTIICLVVVTVSALSYVGVLKPLIVVSGSMEPAISTGSLALSTPADPVSVHPGEIVSLPRSDGVLVTHRVVEVKKVHGDLWEFKLKGDANATADAELYQAATVLVPRVVIPDLGTALAWVMNHRLAMVALLSLGVGSYLGLKLLVDIRTSAASKRSESVSHPYDNLHT